MQKQQRAKARLKSRLPKVTPPLAISRLSFPHLYKCGNSSGGGLSMVSCAAERISYETGGDEKVDGDAFVEKGIHGRDYCWRCGTRCAQSFRKKKRREDGQRHEQG